MEVCLVLQCPLVYETLSSSGGLAPLCLRNAVIKIEMCWASRRCGTAYRLHSGDIRVMYVPGMCWPSWWRCCWSSLGPSGEAAVVSSGPGWLFPRQYRSLILIILQDIFAAVCNVRVDTALVSHRPFTLVARVPYQTSPSCGIYGEPSGNGTGFLGVLGVPPPPRHYNSATVPYSL